MRLNTHMLYCLLLGLPLMWQSTTDGAAPHERVSIPALVHMTTRDSANVSCQEVRLVEQWMDVNYDYKLVMADDESMRQLIAAYYPQHLELYDGLLLGVERADLWRYLVVHRYGGVYADTDVEALIPLYYLIGDEILKDYDPPIRLIVGKEMQPWNECDAAQCAQFIFAAVPGHPVLDLVVQKMKDWVISKFFNLYLGETVNYMATIINRTGPVVWSEAIADYLLKEGYIDNISELERESSDPRQYGDVLILPWEVWSSFCGQVLMNETISKTAFNCHHFYGTWKDKEYWPWQPNRTYGDNCTLPDSVLVPFEREAELLALEARQEVAWWRRMSMLLVPVVVAGTILIAISIMFMKQWMRWTNQKDQQETKKKDKAMHGE